MQKVVAVIEVFFVSLTVFPCEVVGIRHDGMIPCTVEHGFSECVSGVVVLQDADGMLGNGDWKRTSIASTSTARALVLTIPPQLIGRSQSAISHSSAFLSQQSQ